MEKIINEMLELIGIIILGGAIGFTSAKGLLAFHDQFRKETIEALKRPTPSMYRFTKRLTDPSR